MVTNYTIHSIMYSYYALKAMKYRVPKVFAMGITTLQSLQIVSNCTVIYIAYNYKVNGKN